MAKRVGRKTVVGKQIAAELPAGFSQRALTRPWLLGGTATAAGMLAIGLASPAMALPVCANNPTNTILCIGPDGPTVEALSATGAYTLTFGALDPGDAYHWTGGLTPSAVTFDAAGNSGTVLLEPNSSIVNDTGNGLVIQSPVNSTVDIYNDIIGGNDGSYNEDGTFEPGDGLRVLGPGHNLTINVYNNEDGSGQVVGADDGIVVLGSGGSTPTSASGSDTIGINNAGTVMGRGLATSSHNDSEGIHISENGTFGDNIAQGVDIENQGLVFGATNAQSPGGHGGGQGISVSADGHIQIDNWTNDVYDEASADGPAAIIGSDGIKAQGEDGININNSANVDDDEEWHSGGLIVGDVNDGVNVVNTTGDVEVENRGTLGDGAGLSNLKTGLNNLSEEGVLPLASTYTLDNGTNFAVRGIWGAEDGVGIDGVDGSVTVDNSDDGGEYLTGGLIVGLAGDAVNINGATDGAEVDNQNGLAWGGIDGVTISNTSEDVTVNNQNGHIFGISEGIDVSNTEDGDVTVNNANGLIEGFYDDGINVNNVDDDHFVYVYNGTFDFSEDMPSSSDGGLIVSADSAISVNTGGTNAWVLIANAVGGGIIGQGTWYKDEPVINLGTLGGEDGGSASIYNAGVMASSHEPYFTRDSDPPEGEGVWDAPTATYVPSPDIGADSLAADVSNISEYVWNGGQSGRITDLSESIGDPESNNSLSNYAQAASDLLVKSRGEDGDEKGGVTEIFNDAGGLMIGRVNLDGSTWTEDGPTVGNAIVNLGTWFTTDRITSEDYYGNDTHGSSHDEIDNAGLIQGAFDNSEDGQEELDFNGVNTFINGAYNLNHSEDIYTSQNGLISLIDNGVGDSLWIDHNFQGQADHSFIGLDVNFAAATPENRNGDIWSGPDDDQTTWRSDRFQLGETHSEDVADGSTGLIIHKTGSGSDMVRDTILVGNVANLGASPNSEDGGCVGDACKDGDTFYIASESQGYLDVGGTGAVQDGMYAWYLTQQNNTGEDGGTNFVLESDWSPQAQSLAGLTTGGQNLWYDTSEAPLNHGGTGPSGADLAVGKTPAPVSGVTAWAKAVGSYFSRTSSATTGAPPVTFDTSLVQDTFGLLAGADFDPGDTSGIRGGAFGGLIGSSMTLGFGASATYMGGTAGLYASYVPDTNSGVFVDGEVKADLLGVSYSAPGAFSATGTMTSVGVTGDAGYKVDAGNNMYVAPVASLSLVDTMLSGFSAGGGTASFSNGLSIRPAIGVEVGTTVAAGDGMSADLSVSAKLVDELGAPNTVTLSDGVHTTSFGDGISGPFAELSANGTLYTSDPTLQVFGSSGVKTNGSFVDVNAKVGVKKSF